MLPQTVQKLAQGVDGMLLLAAVIRQPELFQMLGQRTDGFPVNAETIRLRGKRLEADAQETPVNFPFFDMLPQARGLIFGTMARAEGEVLWRADVVRVAPGQVALQEALPEGQQHYVICLQGFAGCNCNGVPMGTGDAFWFSGAQALQMTNNSEADQYLLLLSLTPNGPSNYVPQL